MLTISCLYTSVYVHQTRVAPLRHTRNKWCGVNHIGFAKADIDELLPFISPETACLAKRRTNPFFTDLDGGFWDSVSVIRSLRPLAKPDAPEFLQRWKGERKGRVGWVRRRFPLIFCLHESLHIILFRSIDLIDRQTDVYTSSWRCLHVKIWEKKTFNKFLICLWFWPWV